MPDALTYEQLLALVGELSARVAGQDRIIAVQADRIAELERRLGADSSNSSRPPSSDAPWDKARAKRRSSRTRSGRNPGKQPGAASSSRSLVEDPDRVVVIEPARCGGVRELAGRCRGVGSGAASGGGCAPGAGSGDHRVPAGVEELPVLRRRMSRVPWNFGDGPVIIRRR